MHSICYHQDLNPEIFLLGMDMLLEVFFLNYESCGGIVVRVCVVVPEFKPCHTKGHQKDTGYIWLDA